MAAADVLIMPSYFESLSIVTLEAWAMGIPALVNGQCDVLRGQTIRANAGLYYTTYGEFSEALCLLETNQQLRETFGLNGRDYFQHHYTWPVIEQKYLNILHQLENNNLPSNVIEPLPGWLTRHRQSIPAASHIVDQLPTGPVFPERLNG